MDKIKAAAKHGFWIAFVLMLPVVAFGYFSASSKILPAIAERSKKLEDVQKSVESPARFSSAPNEDYAAGLKVYADEFERLNLQAKLGLWTYQLPDMNWPPVIADLMEQAGLRGYRGIEKEETNRLVTLRRKYAEGYPGQIEQLFKSFEPYVGEKYNGKDVDWPQKVLVSDKAIPQDRIQPNTNVSASRMWDAQEDIWLTRIIAEVIREMNAQAEGINKAAIRKIDRLTLTGGSGEPQFGAAASLGSTGGEYYSYGGESSGMESYGGAEAGGAAAAKQTKVDFDTAEVFGPASDSAAMGAMADYESMSTGTASFEPPKRYIGEVAEDAPYFERGFYLNCLIEESRLDDFLISLSSTKWPIRIARFQIGPNPYFKEQTRSPLTPPGGGYPGGGFPGGGYPGGGYPGGGYPGGSGYPGGGGAYSGSDYTEDYSSDYPGGEGGSGYPGAGGGTGFGIAAGTATAVTDPVASAAISSPDLITLAITGAITIYAQPGEAVLPDPLIYPVPVEGQPYEMPKPADDPNTSSEVAMTDPTNKVLGTSDETTASNN